jgi:hypothetical protein
MLYYAILLALFLLFLLAFHRCFLPHGRLPRFRVRYLRARLVLRLHPGRGHATLPGLWLPWGRFAAFRRSRRSRPSLPAWVRFCFPDQHSLLLGRAHLGHGLRVPIDEHLLVMALKDASRLVAWVGRLEAGNRNSGLYWAACRAIEAGQVQLLDELAVAAGRTGLSEQEISQTMSSARRGGQRQSQRQAECERT